jgi:hypothetical protein
MINVQCCDENMSIVNDDAQHNTQRGIGRQRTDLSDVPSTATAEISG